jgi:CBS domain-containing protein
MIYCSPNDSLFEAAQTLMNEHIHRLPIIDKENDNSILHFVSHHRIFVFMINNVTFLLNSLLNFSISTVLIIHETIIIIETTYYYYYGLIINIIYLLSLSSSSLLRLLLSCTR